MTTPGLVWTLDRTRSGRGRPPRVSRDAVVRAAVDILDAGSADSMTMRALADRLDVALGTVYTYAPSQEAVFDLACDAAIGDMPPWFTDDGDWLTSARAYLDGLRSLCERHQWWPILYPLRPLIGPNGLRLREECLQLLIRAGFAFADREPVMMSLTHLAVGTMLIENTWRLFPTRDQAEVESVRRYVLSKRKSFPNFGAIMEDYVAVTDPDLAREARWSATVDSALIGLSARLETSLTDRD